MEGGGEVVKRSQNVALSSRMPPATIRRASESSARVRDTRNIERTEDLALTASRIGGVAPFRASLAAEESHLPVLVKPSVLQIDHGPSDQLVACKVIVVHQIHLQKVHDT